MSGMDALDQFVKDYIMSEINERGFIYLSDEKMYITNIDERYQSEMHSINQSSISKSTKLIFLRSLRDSIKRDGKPFFKGKEHQYNSFLVILDYHIFLYEQNFDLRFRRRIRELIIDRIKKKRKYKVINDKFIVENKKCKIKFIYNLSEFITFSNTDFKDFKNIFFRGHSNLYWKPIPSIYRNNWIKNEHKMFREIIIRNSSEFQTTKSTFEKLTIMQHYGLPTRLLDITKNPLIALYFACCDKSQTDHPGEIIVFTPNDDIIKYYDSDTVSILSNLSKVERELDSTLDYDFFNNNYIPGLKLLNLIKEEKPYFLNQIIPNDLQKTLIVKPINNNERIKKQFGYFFLFGIGKNISQPAEINSVLIDGNIKTYYIIDSTSKSKIMQELDALGINSETLFPEIENGTEYLKSKY